MAFMKGIIDLRGILFLMLLTVTSQATNLDCYGKAFHCVNSTHFMICVDLGRGTSTTIDDVVIPCPSPTVCKLTNRFECEFPLPYIPSSTVATTELRTTESEVTTFAPLPPTLIPFEEYFDTVSTTTQSQNDLKKSQADTIVDASSLLTTIKLVLSDVNTTPVSVVDDILSSQLSDINASNVESKVSLSVSETPNDVTAVNNNQANMNQTQVTESSYLNTEYITLATPDSKDITSTKNYQKGNTENVFTTDFGLTLEDKTGTMFLSDITTEPVNIIISPADVSSIMTEQTVTTEQAVVKSLQEVVNTSSINNDSVSFDTIILKELIQNAKKINKPQVIGDTENQKSGDFNKVGDISVNASSIDYTNIVTEKIINTEQNLTDITTPLELTQDLNNLNASQFSRDPKEHVTNNFSDLSKVNEAASVLTVVDQFDNGVTMMESSVLNANQSISSNKILYQSTKNETTQNTEPVLIKDFIEPLVIQTTTETAFITTKTSTYEISSNVISAITEETVTNEQVPTSTLEEPSIGTITDNLAFAPNTASTVEELNKINLNASTLVKSVIDNSSAGFFGINVIHENTTNIVIITKGFGTPVTDSLVKNNVDDVIPTYLPMADISTNTSTAKALATTENNTSTDKNNFNRSKTESIKNNTFIRMTDEPNYQEASPSIPALILNYSSFTTENVISTEPTKDNITTELITEKVIKWDITSIADALATTEYNTSADKNNFNRSKTESIKNNTVIDKANENLQDFTTTQSTVPKSVTEYLVTPRNHPESDFMNINTSTVRTSIEEPIHTVIPPGNLISTTKGSDIVTEIRTAISKNDLEILTNTNTPNIYLNNIINVSLSNAETISYDIDNQTSKTDRPTQNEKVLFTNYLDNQASTQSYQSNVNSTIETSTRSVLETMADLLSIEERTIESNVGNKELPKVITTLESRNEVSNESAIMSSVKLLDKFTVTDNSTPRKDMIHINYDTSTVSQNNSIPVRADAQTKMVTDMPSTSILNVTNSPHVDTVSSVKEQGDQSLSTEEYQLTLTTIAIPTLPTPIAILKQNQTLSIKTPHLTDTLTTNTSKSLPSTPMAITETAYTSSQQGYSSINNVKVLYDTANYSTNYGIGIKTVALFTNNTNLIKTFVQNIDELTIKSDVPEQHADNKKETKLQLSQSETTVQQPTIVTHTISINDTLSNNSSTTENNNLLYSLTLASEMIQSNINNSITTEGIKASEVPKEPYNASNYFRTDVHSATTPFTSSIYSSITNNDSVNEITHSFSVTESSSTQADSTLGVTSPFLLEISEKYQSPIRSTVISQNSLNTQLPIYGNDVVTDSADNNLGITEPITENGANILLIENGVNERPKTETNRAGNVMLSSSSSTIKPFTKPKNFYSPEASIQTIPETAVEVRSELPVTVNADKIQTATIKISNAQETPMEVHVTDVTRDLDMNLSLGQTQSRGSLSSIGAANTVSALGTSVVGTPIMNTVYPNTIADLSLGQTQSPMSSSTGANITQLINAVDLNIGTDIALNKTQSPGSSSGGGGGTTVSRTSNVVGSTQLINAVDLNNATDLPLGQTQLPESFDNIGGSTTVLDVSTVAVSAQLMNTVDPNTNANLSLGQIQLSESPSRESSSGRSGTIVSRTSGDAGSSQLINAVDLNIATDLPLGQIQSPKSSSDIGNDTIVPGAASAQIMGTVYPNTNVDLPLGKTQSPESSSSRGVGITVSRATNVASTPVINDADPYTTSELSLGQTQSSGSFSNKASDTTLSSAATGSASTYPIHAVDSNINSDLYLSQTQPSRNSSGGGGNGTAAISGAGTIAAITQIMNAVNLNIATDIPLGQTQSPGSSINRGSVTTLPSANNLAASTLLMKSVDPNPTADLSLSHIQLPESTTISDASVTIYEASIYVSTTSPDLSLSQTQLLGSSSSRGSGNIVYGAGINAASTPIINAVGLNTRLSPERSRSDADNTVAGTIASAVNIQQVNAVDQSTTPVLSSSQTKSSGNSINVNSIILQTPDNVVEKSEIKINTTLNINRFETHKITEKIDSVTNLESITAPFKRNLANADDLMTFTDNTNTKMDDKFSWVAMFSTRQPTESEGNVNIENNNINSTREKGSGAAFGSRKQITDVQNVKGIQDNTKSPSITSADFGTPTEIITTLDVVVNSDIKSEKTHSGMISIIKTTKSHEPKEITDEKQHKNVINVELTTLKDKGQFSLSTDIPPVTLKHNSDNYAREEVLLKTENINYKSTNNNSENFSTKIITHKNIHDDTNTTGYKIETPTDRLIENSTSSTNDIHTSNNKSLDQDTSFSQAHNMTVISNDQSSTSRYMSEAKSTAATDLQTTGFPALELTSRKTEISTFSCKKFKRGKYSDELDCRKFYICPGNKSSHVIVGNCPVNTVFSEINKQCTKNLSHCIRNNQFRCVTEGRFSDFLNDNVYYLCVKNNLSHFIRFKLQCQNGYHLNKTSVRCELNNEATSTSVSQDSKNVSEQSSPIKQDIHKISEKKFKCKKEGTFPDPSNCRKYFECTQVDSSYRQKMKKCDSDEIFHKDKKECVDADSYEC